MDMMSMRRKITGALGGSSSTTRDVRSSQPSSSSPPSSPSPSPHCYPPLSSSAPSAPRPLSASMRVPTDTARSSGPVVSASTTLSSSVHLTVNSTMPPSPSPVIQSSPLHQHQPIPPRRNSVAWVPDSLAEKCYKCQSNFSLMLRRHHCRRCGNVFCDACTLARMPLATAGHFTPVRVCDKCCIAAKKAHARMVEERQQQWLQQQPQQRHRQQRLRRGGHSDDDISYDGDAVFSVVRGAPPMATSSLAMTSRRGMYAPQSVFLRSQTSKDLRAALAGDGTSGGSASLMAKQLFADPYLRDDDDDDDDHTIVEKRARMKNGASEVSVHTLPGEVVLARNENVLCRLMHQGEQSHGTLYVTNYRLVFSPYVHRTDDDSDESGKPMAVYQAIAITSLQQLKRQQTADTDSGVIDLVTKDFRHVQFQYIGLIAKQTFNQFDSTVATIRQYAFGEPVGIREPFAICSAAATATAMATEDLAELPFDGWNLYDAASEFTRMGVGIGSRNMTPRWRISQINNNYSLCGTYPSLLVVPAGVTDHVLTVASKFRSKARIPVLSWRDTRTGAVICRSSQPLVGLGGRQCDKDVFLIQAIAVANPSSSKLVIIDARPWKNAVAQKTVGSAGYELTEHYETRHTQATSKYADMAASYSEPGAVPRGAALSAMPSPPGSNDTPGDARYEDDDDGSASTVSDRFFKQMDASSVDPSLVLTECKLIFMGIENVHTMRASYVKLLELCCIHKPNDKWLERLASTRWVEHLSKILDSAVEIVRIVKEQKSSVLVHCSDGWDRTPQLTALAQLMLDPYYRTVMGFQILIEKEWCSFGHKFRDRTAHGVNPSSSRDSSPVFLQFIDCVWQVYRQFPYAFEFNEQFLILILDHLYSCRFGTFLYDSEKECRTKETQHKTISLWTFIASLDRNEITNPFYSPPRKFDSLAFVPPPMNGSSPPPTMEEILSASSPSPQSRDDDEDQRVEQQDTVDLLEEDDAASLFPRATSGGGPTSAPIRIPTVASPARRRASSPALGPSQTNCGRADGNDGKGQPNSDSLWSVDTEVGNLSECGEPGRLAFDNTPFNGDNSNEDEDVLVPCALSRALKFWSRYYLRWDPSSTSQRVSSARVEASHRELQFRLMEATHKLQVMQIAMDQQERGYGGGRQRLESEDAMSVASAAEYAAAMEQLQLQRQHHHQPPFVESRDDLPELVPVLTKPMASGSAAVLDGVAAQLDALAQRKREAHARIEKEFEEEAAKLLKPAVVMAAHQGAGATAAVAP